MPTDINNTNNTKLTLPAEWAPQSGVQLTWPHEATDWKPILPEITNTYVEMAIEIAKREKLIIVAPQPECALRAIGQKAGVEVMRNITVTACPTNDTWARDHGFITLASAGEYRLIDFKFNGWGEKFAADKDNLINKHLHREGIVNGLYEDHNDFVLEGGSIESDGQGTVITTTGCLMAPHRNQPLTQQQIEQRLKNTLRADRILWIDHGNLAGDDTDGHIDTLVRLAPDNTLLYMGCDNTDNEQYHELALMEQDVMALRTADGKPYRLIKLPSPRPIYHDGERLPATYANFLVINGAVLYPTYGQPDLDTRAGQLIGMAFTGRDMVPIDCRSIIIQHGSLHCCTMQYPEGVL